MQLGFQNFRDWYSERFCMIPSFHVSENIIIIIISNGSGSKMFAHHLLLVVLEFFHRHVRLLDNVPTPPEHPIQHVQKPTHSPAQLDHLSRPAM